MRITGGIHRSRKLVAPRGSATRPTSDRVREALFSFLTVQGALEGAAVLDLYAGTGALSFEALSRGAKTAVLVEPSRDAREAIRANAVALRVEGAIEVVPVTVERAGSRVAARSPFDLVFADPPYADVASGAVRRALTALLQDRQLVLPGGLLLLEHGKRDEPPELPGLDLHHTRQYGDTSIAVYTAVAAP
jgi:16S rRNA (guanine(966)-N(2))-methyltransferase RsmD